MPKQRAWLIAPLLASHAALLLMALPATAPAPSAAAAMTVSQVAAPVLPAPAPEFTPVEVAIAAEAAAPDIDIAPEAAGGTCALSDRIQLALRDTPAVSVALGQVPQSARSVAEAVMLWDGVWTDATRVGGDATLAPIRDTVRASIRAASPACAAAAVAGPRLVYVAVDGRTMILAFGSGSWAWNDLLV